MPIGAADVVAAAEVFDDDDDDDEAAGVDLSLLQPELNITAAATEIVAAAIIEIRMARL